MIHDHLSHLGEYLPHDIGGAIGWSPGMCSMNAPVIMSRSPVRSPHQVYNTLSTVLTPMGSHEAGTWQGCKKVCMLHAVKSKVCVFAYIPWTSMYGIFTYIWLIFMVNVGKYTSPMDPQGLNCAEQGMYFSILNEELFLAPQNPQKSQGRYFGTSPTTLKANLTWDAPCLVYNRYPWTPKPWKMKGLSPQYMGYNT